MPTESESQVSSNGSSSTVTVTVRETGGPPGSNLRYADIFLHIEPEGLIVEPGRNPTPAAEFVDPHGITVWWKDVQFIKGAPDKRVRLRVRRRRGMGPLACNRVHVLVAFEHISKVHVHHGWICGRGSKISIVK